jgi:hypothetical protein
MFQRKHVWLLSVITISAVYLSYSGLAARWGFVGNVMVDVLLCGLVVAWMETFRSRRQA